MKPTLSHGPWSIIVATPSGICPPLRCHYTFNEAAQVDTTYCWNWKGQPLDGTNNCTVSYSSLGASSTVAWNTSIDQRAWYNVAKSALGNAQAVPAQYVKIELSTTFLWESDAEPAEPFGVVNSVNTAVIIRALGDSSV
ncbi:MAG: hypothetical protein RR517_30755 [Pseudomonas sp.]